MSARKPVPLFGHVLVKEMLPEPPLAESSA